MLYLLNISRVNPLDFDLSYENFFGLEVEKSKSRASQPSINMVVSTECYSAILKKVKSEQILQNKKIETRNYSFSIGKISISYFDMSCEIKGYYSETNYNTLLKFILEEYDDDGFANAIDTVFDHRRDISLADKIRVFGLLHSSWNFDDILIAFEKLNLPLLDVPVFYDDVFDVLLHNFTNKDAWKYADSIHWGYGSPQEVKEHLTPAIFHWSIVLFTYFQRLMHWIILFINTN